MIAFTPIDINPSYSSIPLEEYMDYDKNSPYPQGSVIKHGRYKYVALRDIPPTVNYTFNKTNPRGKQLFNLYTEEYMPDIDNIDIVENETLFWSILDKKYFKAKTTKSIDLTVENPFNETDFEDLDINPTPLYRTRIEIPHDRKDTLDWGYDGVLNRYKMFDSILNSGTVNNRKFTDIGMVAFSGDEIILSDKLSSDIFIEDLILIDGTLLNNKIVKILDISNDRKTITVDNTFADETVDNVTLYTQTRIVFNTFGIDKIALYNVDCENIEIKYYVGDTEHLSQSEQMLDHSFITTFELFCFNMPEKKTNIIFDIIKQFNQTIELTFFGRYQNIGELLIGSSIYLGIVEDSISVDGKVYGEIIEANNGDIYVSEDITIENSLERKSFTMVIKQFESDMYREIMKRLIGKRVVLSGNLVYNDNEKVLLTYGLIKDYKFSPQINHELSTYQFEIREFRKWQI